MKKGSGKPEPLLVVAMFFQTTACFFKNIIREVKEHPDWTD